MDRPASIGALPLTAAREAGCQVAYLPGLAMRRIAGHHPGEVKTDAKDATVIADAARTMPRTPRTLGLPAEVTAEPAVPVGSDQDLAGPDLGARHRRQDRRGPPDRRRRRQFLPHRRLERAMFLSASAALHGPACRAYYDRCRKPREGPPPGTPPARPTMHQRPARDAP
nr:IS110 family transposase [Streptomyces mutabilis]